MLFKKITRCAIVCANVSFRNMSSSTDSVLFETINKAGIVTLNRPKALNALNLEMVNEMYPTLRKWETQKKLVIVKGTGEKAFCAGGDVRAVTEAAKAGEKLGENFFRAEYQINRLIGNYSIPYIAFIDGITMGGGLGISVHGQYRIATERTMIAMPETQIGLFPDVGGTFFLPRLAGNLGLYLGLTGHRLKGIDVFKAGIATHFVPSNKLQELQTLLTRSENPNDIFNLLNKFNDPSGEFSLSENMKQITYCFAAATIEEIFERLERDGSEWAEKTVQTLHKMSPGSLKITLRALQRGSQLDLSQCLQMEYRIACRALQNKDFIEGVRALLIDKDNNPRWDPRTLDDVTDTYIESYFKKLPVDEELKFYESKM